MKVLTKPRMKVVLSLITLSLFLAFGITYVRSLPSRQSKMEGATITLRVYIQNPDGTVVEKGKKVVELSASGNWRKTIYDEKGRVTQIVIKDVAKGGVFLILPTNRDTAYRMSGAVAFTNASEPDEYRSRPNYKGETTVFGRTAFKQRQDGVDGGSTIEMTMIPAYDYPVKQAESLRNGSMKIEEAVSIDATEPDPERVKLPANLTISDRHMEGGNK